MEQNFLLPTYKHCTKCSKVLLQRSKLQNDIFYFCKTCLTYTKWNNNTLLCRSFLPFSEIQILIVMFLDNRTAKEASETLKYYFIDKEVHLNTIIMYFSIFSDIVLAYYIEYSESTLLDGEIELDESQLYKTKLSNAPHRPLKYAKIWMFGMLKRGNNHSIIIQLRKEIKKHWNYLF